MKDLSATLVFAAICAVSSSAVAQTGGTRPITLRELRTAVERAESGWTSVEIKASCAMSRIVDGERDRAGDVHVQMLRIARPGSLIKIHYNPEVLKAGDKFLVDESKATYDGRFTYTWAIETGNEGETRLRLNRGRIVAGRSKLFDSAAQYVGWTSTIYGFFENKGKRFSEFLRSLGSSGHLSGDGKTVTLELRAREGSSQLWLFDRSKAFALQEYRRTIKGKVVRQDQMSDFVQVKSGVWYPKSIRVSKASYRVPGATTVWDVGIESIAADQSGAVPEERYVLRYGRGVIVNDLVGGQTLRVGRQPNELLKIVNRQVANVKAMLLRASSPPSDWYSWLPWVLAAGLVLLIVYVAKRRKANRHRVLTGSGS